MTAEQVRDVILAETKTPIFGWQLNELVEARFADVDPDTVSYGIVLASLELQRRPEWLAAHAAEFEHLMHYRGLRVV